MIARFVIVERRCADCGTAFFGRTNKFFCSTRCRRRFHKKGKSRPDSRAAFIKSRFGNRCYFGHEALGPLVFLTLHGRKTTPQRARYAVCNNCILDGALDKLGIKPKPLFNRAALDTALDRIEEIE